MPIETWWPALSPATRAWLVAHNGEPVPLDVAREVEDAGGPAPSDGWWVVDAGSGRCMPDEAVDWVEAVANDEGP